MKLTQGQQQAIQLLAGAFGALSKEWTDELGEALNAVGLLPSRCLMEAEAECLHIAEDGEIII